MAGLNNEKCEACRRDSPSVTDEQVAQLKPEIPEWELIHENGIPNWIGCLRLRTFKLPCSLPFGWETWRKTKDTTHV